MLKRCSATVIFLFLFFSSVGVLAGTDSQKRVKENVLQYENNLVSGDARYYVDPLWYYNGAPAEELMPSDPFMYDDMTQEEYDELRSQYEDIPPAEPQGKSKEDVLYFYDTETDNVFQYYDSGDWVGIITWGEEEVVDCTYITK